MTPLECLMTWEEILLHHKCPEIKTDAQIVLDSELGINCITQPRETVLSAMISKLSFRTNRKFLQQSMYFQLSHDYRSIFTRSRPPKTGTNHCISGLLILWRPQERSGWGLEPINQSFLTGIHSDTTDQHTQTGYGPSDNARAVLGSG